MNQEIKKKIALATIETLIRLGTNLKMLELSFQCHVSSEKYSTDAPLQLSAHPSQSCLST